MSPSFLFPCPPSAHFFVPGGSSLLCQRDPLPRFSRTPMLPLPVSRATNESLQSAHRDPPGHGGEPCLPGGPGPSVTLVVFRRPGVVVLVRPGVRRRVPGPHEHPLRTPAPSEARLRDVVPGVPYGLVEVRVVLVVRTPSLLSSVSLRALGSTQTCRGGRRGSGGRVGPWKGAHVSCL